MTRIEVDPSGELLSASQVHRHHDPALAVPFVVVVVALDAGPVLKGVLAAQSSTPSIGSRVHGVLTQDKFQFKVDL